MTLLAPLRLCLEDSGGADEAEDHYTPATPANQLRVAANASLKMVAFSIWKETREGTGDNQQISETLWAQLITWIGYLF